MDTFKGFILGGLCFHKKWRSQQLIKCYFIVKNSVSAAKNETRVLL